MSHPGPSSERAIILAPSGRDSQIAALILRESDFCADVVADLNMLCAEIQKGAGLAIIADEAIRGADLRALTAVLSQQMPWSDFPIILMMQRGGGLERNPAAASLAEILGNVAFLERPFHPTTLASMVRTAVRGRLRQYEARARLEKLRESEEQLQTALKAGNLGSWALRFPDMALSTSESGRAHFGRGPGDSLNVEDLHHAIHGEDLPRVQSAFEMSRTTGADYVIECRNVWPNGTVHWIDARARALKNDSGEVYQLVGVSSDITARKTSEIERERLLGELAVERAALSSLTASLEQRVHERTAELIAEVAAKERAQEQLLQSQKMESIGHLTGGVAHDFNNLLMAVMGNLELLRKRVPDDPRAQRLIDGALEGAQRGASLTQRMLAFARRQDLKTCPADLGALLTGMRELLERSLGPQIKLNFDIPQGLPQAQVDPHQIELAILNLAINARDAMMGGGTIDIGLNESHGRSAKSIRPGSYLRVSVADSGCGMSEETLHKAVEPFFSTKPLGKGTGLGLSMVHGVAIQLRGALELVSEIGKGTTATLWLPTAMQPAATETRCEIAVAHGRPATILVVDDDPLIAMSTVDMLEDLGHTVIEANSGQQALAILDGGQAVDMMMTDQAMPGMTGVELAEIVRRKRPALPVLLATGYGDLPNGLKDDLPRLSKPYRQSQLREQINRLLESS